MRRYFSGLCNGGLAPHSPKLLNHMFAAAGGVVSTSSPIKIQPSDYKHDSQQRGRRFYPAAAGEHRKPANACLGNTYLEGYHNRDTTSPTKYIHRLQRKRLPRDAS